MSRADELRVLTDSLERVLLTPFPAHDQWGSGHLEWKKQRDETIKELREQIQKLLASDSSAPPPSRPKDPSHAD